LEVHPAEYKSSEESQAAGSERQDAVSHTITEPSSTGGIDHDSTTNTQQEQKSQSIWKQVNLKLDWAHIGSDAITPSFLQPCSREQELQEVNKKIAEIKAVARRSAPEQTAASTLWPWLVEDMTVAACMCAKSKKAAPAVNLLSSSDNTPSCCKRQKMS
jgi:hypothetical protein